MALAVHTTEIDGLWLIDLIVNEDPDRPGATFREAYQGEKMHALGLPEFHPVQFNVSDSPLGTLPRLPRRALGEVHPRRVGHRVLRDRRHPSRLGHLQEGVVGRAPLRATRCSSPAVWRTRSRP